VAAWRGLGNPAGSAGYKYKQSDAATAPGGVIKVNYKPGRLSVTAKGASWPWAPAGAQDDVWVHFRVGDEWYCAQFGGTITQNGANVFAAKTAPSPAACPAQVCGNGIVETGEACDDGNLDDGDGCTATCAVGGCIGQSFASTWDAIYQKVFVENGCTSAICHGASPGQGNLDLTPASAHADLVNAPSTSSPLDRVEPGDEDLSFLYGKLWYAKGGPAVPGSPMPVGLPPISDDLLEAVRLWIRAGGPATGVVEGTAPLLDSCLPPATPNKIPPLPPADPSLGIYLYSPPWDLPAQSETEVCYATYYDVTSIVPAQYHTPCPSWMGGSSQTCFKYHSTEFRQDPQSHHSIVHVYRGAYDWTDPGWGTWTCHGGANAGMACNPTNIGVLAPAGADCGPQSGCAGSLVHTAGCVFYGPPDYGFNNNLAPSFGGAQEAVYDQEFADGVFNVLPLKSIVVWNHHAFNLTTFDTTMEQYMNLYYAAPADQLYQAQSLFDDTEIFVMNVPPFESREYCRTFTFPLNARIFDLSSHTHKRGKLFRIWAPPQTSCTASSGCLPDPGVPIYQSTEYNDPVRLEFDPPWHLSSTTASNRRIKFCSKYDNGETDINEVKRQSTSPIPVLPVGGPCPDAETRCIGGPQHNQLCNGNHAFCGSSPGLGDGMCDACPLEGGITTEDEMFIALGTYYIAP
jgi:cysteine-rich repeat protein